MNTIITKIDIMMQEFSSALAAHVELAAKDMPGTVWHVWTTGADTYIVELDSDPITIDQRCERWIQDGEWSGKGIETVYYAKVGIDAEGDEVESDEGSVDCEVGEEETEPDCADDQEHDWQSPEWLGGCRENPGVWSKNNRLTSVEVCANCGAYKHWKDSSIPGQYPKEPEVTTYEESDKRSRKWAGIGEFAPQEWTELDVDPAPGEYREHFETAWWDREDGLVRIAEMSTEENPTKYYYRYRLDEPAEGRCFDTLEEAKA